MNTFERRLLVRFATAFAALVGLGVALIALALGGRVFDALTEGGPRHDALSLLARAADALEPVVLLTGPLAMLRTALVLRDGGLLTAMFAAGLPPSALRRTALAAAAIVAGSLVAVTELANHVRGAALGGGGAVWAAGEDWLAWRPRAAAAGPTYLFGAHDLSVTIATTVADGGGLTVREQRPWLGTRPAPSRLPRPPAERPLNAAAPLSSWWTGSASGAERRAGLLRLLASPLLTALCAYVVALSRGHPAWQLYVGFLTFAQGLGMAMVATLARARAGDAGAGTVAVALLGTLAVAVAAAEALFRRLGCRDAG